MTKHDEQIERNYERLQIFNETGNTTGWYIGLNQIKQPLKDEIFNHPDYQKLLIRLLEILSHEVFQSGKQPLLTLSTIQPYRRQLNNFVRNYKSTNNNTEKPLIMYLEDILKTLTPNTYMHRMLSRYIGMVRQNKTHEVCIGTLKRNICYNDIIESFINFIERKLGEYHATKSC